MPGTKTKLKDGKYRLTVSNGFRADGKQNRATKTVGPCSEREASRLLEEFYIEFKKKPPIVNNTMSFAKFITVWEKRQPKDQSYNTFTSNLSFVNTHIKPYLGGVKLKKLSPDNIIEFIDYLKSDAARKDDKGGKLSAGTIYNVFKILRSMLSKAVEWKYLPSNPCNEIPKEKRPPKSYGKAEILQEQDLARFLQALFDLPDNMTNTKHKLFNYMSLIDGCREGEHIALQWDNIDLENKVIHIEHGCYYKDRKTYQKDPKSTSSRRKVFIDDLAVELLKKHKAYQDKHLASHNMTNPNNYVFIKSRNIGKEAEMTSQSMVYKWLTGFLRKNGLPHIPVHSLRRMAASYYLVNNVPITDVQAMMGHSNIATTNMYIRSIEQSRKSSTEKMSKFHQSLIAGK